MTSRTVLDRLAIGVPYQDKSNIGRRKKARQDKRCRGIWDRKKQRPHPSTFPVALPEMCGKLHAIKDTRLMLDPFIGIGSTALACLRPGIGIVGFEIDAAYLKTAVERIRSFLG